MYSCWNEKGIAGVDASAKCQYTESLELFCFFNNLKERYYEIQHAFQLKLSQTLYIGSMTICMVTALMNDWTWCFSISTWRQNSYYFMKYDNILERSWSTLKDIPWKWQSGTSSLNFHLSKEVASDEHCFSTADFSSLGSCFMYTLK